MTTLRVGRCRGGPRHGQNVAFSKPYFTCAKLYRLKPPPWEVTSPTWADMSTLKAIDGDYVLHREVAWGKEQWIWKWMGWRE